MQAHDKTNVIALREEGFTVKRAGGKVGILTAGTSDMVAGEMDVISSRLMGEVQSLLTLRIGLR